MPGGLAHVSTARPRGRRRHGLGGAARRHARVISIEGTPRATIGDLPGIRGLTADEDGVWVIGASGVARLLRLASDGSSITRVTSSMPPTDIADADGSVWVSLADT